MVCWNNVLSMPLNFNIVFPFRIFTYSTGIFVQQSDLNVPREDFQMTRLEGQAIVLGGDMGGNRLLELETFNPADGTWSVLPGMDMPIGRIHFCKVNMDEQELYVVGGKLADNTWTDIMEKFTLTSGWETLTGQIIPSAENKPACLIII